MPQNNMLNNVNDPNTNPSGLENSSLPQKGLGQKLSSWVCTFLSLSIVLATAFEVINTLKLQNPAEEEDLVEIPSVHKQTITKHSIINTSKKNYCTTLFNGTEVELRPFSKSHFFGMVGSGIQKFIVEGEIFFTMPSVLAQKDSFIIQINDRPITLFPKPGNVFRIYADPKKKIVTVNVVKGEGLQLNTNILSAILQPQTTAEVYSDGVIVKNINTQKTMKFDFEAKTIYFMSQISKWYNVNIQYDQKIADRRFFVRIKREYELKTILEVLELNGIKSTIKGETVFLEALN